MNGEDIWLGAGPDCPVWYTIYAPVDYDNPVSAGGPGKWAVDEADCEGNSGEMCYHATQPTPF